jgi:BirA family biotin operon repressor/biotin-[acetyl-CoA-carboxylase] ligase
VSELSVARITAALGTAWAGRRVVYYPAVGSTNHEAKRLAEAGAPEGTLVVADYQTAGRGRLARRWWSPPGSSLLLSLVFRPTFLAPHQAQRLTMIGSLAVCDAAADVTGLAAAVKWPNDVLVGGRKVCGLLAELGSTGSRLEYVVVGLGVNVNVDFGDGDAPALATPATSLKAELGRQVSRLDVLAAWLHRVEARYERLRAGALPHDEWQSRLVTLGQVVQVTMSSRVLVGLAVGVDADGALLVQEADGVVEKVLAGDVTLRKESEMSRLEG